MKPNFPTPLKIFFVKKKLLQNITAIGLLFFCIQNFAQAPNLGSAANFILFSSNGTISNKGTSTLTGNVGTRRGTTTGFGNVNGVMYNNDAASSICSSDLLNAYNQLNTTTSTFFHAVTLGNGEVLTPGVYSVSGNASLHQTLTLNAKSNANAVFIFKIQGTFSSTNYAKINLINGAQPSNIFWKVEGGVSLATGTVMKGTVIANNGKINFDSDVLFEGRALTTTGNVSVNRLTANTPTLDETQLLTGPAAPVSASTARYALFSYSGAVNNKGVTFAAGDVGTHMGSIDGYTSSQVSGTIHFTPDGSTRTCALDLFQLNEYLNRLPVDIELLHPGEFGNNLVLTPHKYLLKSATVLTDTLYLNAKGNADAVFVIKVNGPFLSTSYARVILTNEAQAANVFWVINGSVSLNNYSDFKGTIISLGAVSLQTGAKLSGRVLTASGALNTASISVTIPDNVNNTSSARKSAEVNGNKNVPSVSYTPAVKEQLPKGPPLFKIYPNPIKNKTATFRLVGVPTGIYNLLIYDANGHQLLNEKINHYGNSSSRPVLLPTNTPSGTYYFVLKSGADLAFTFKQTVLIL